MSVSVSRASNVFNSDELCEASSSSHVPYPSPLFSPSIAGPSDRRPDGFPFVASTSKSRRSVIFSARNDTKLFHSADSILPSPKSSPTRPPPSIRSYLHEQDTNQASNHPSSNSPTSTPAAARAVDKSGFTTPTILVRSILKSRVSDIRVALSVEEGTLNNKEPARLLVCGKRPQLIARDSYQLAMLRRAAGEGISAMSSGKGKDVPQMPSSDDDPGLDELEDGNDLPRNDEDSEEEEVVEADGALTTGSLVEIILSGAEDLLTLEEAYSTLTNRLRQKLAPGYTPRDLATTAEDAIRIAIQPIREEAPAMVRAMLRDLGRLMGKVPMAEALPSSDDGEDNSPFRGLQPLRDSTSPPGPPNRYISPTGQRAVPAKGKKSPEPRQGYTRAEVLYRREAAGVGAAMLKFLAVVFHDARLHRGFSDTDLTALLDQVLVIPRTPKLPTPHSRKTYLFAMLVISQMKLPETCVVPLKTKLVRVLELAMTESPESAAGASGTKDVNSAFREGFSGVINLLSRYPSTFIQHYAELSPLAVKGMSHPSPGIRNKAAAACAALVSAKQNLLTMSSEAMRSEPSDQTREEYLKAKALVQKMEIFAASHLKATMKVPGRSGPIYGANGEKKLEANALEAIFKSTIGTTEGVLWACASWSVVISLLGSNYAASGLARVFDYIMNRSIAPSNNTVRPLLSRMAWCHLIHAYFTSSSVSAVSASNELTVSSALFPSTKALDSTAYLHLIQTPVDMALELANGSDGAVRVLLPAEEAQPARYSWQRSEKGKRHAWMITCGAAAIPIVYAYTGMALYHRDPTAEPSVQVPDSSSDDVVPPVQVDVEAMRYSRLDQVWEKVAQPILSGLLAVRGVDKLKTTGWSILVAITASAEAPANDWSLDSLLTTRYLTGEAFGIEKESTLLDFMKDLGSDAIKPNAIPAWGSMWIIHNFEAMMTMFISAVQGLQGLNDVSCIEWTNSSTGELLLPTDVMRIWSNLIDAIKAYRLTAHGEDQRYSNILLSVTTTLVRLIDMDPASYQPISILSTVESGTGDASVQDQDVCRLGMFSELYRAAVNILGQEAVSTPLFALPLLNQGASSSTEVLREQAFGVSTKDQYSMTGVLLGRLLRSNLFSSITDTASPMLRDLLSDMIQQTASMPGAGKLVGDITVAVPTIFTDNEAMQLDLWRIIARYWIATLDTSPPTTVEGGKPVTNHTGTILVSLLADPFRRKAVTSLWHQQASERDLALWTDLLHVTLARSKAKGLDGNETVLESLAVHLIGVFSAGHRTRSTTISLSCLAAAIRSLQSSETTSAFSPQSLLKLLSDGLLESFPSPETLAGLENYSISPAVGELIDAISNCLPQLPFSSIDGNWRSLKAGITIWMSGTGFPSIVELGHRLDRLYVNVLASLESAIVSGTFAPSSALLDEFMDLIAPRLSLATSPAVLKAFQSFWQNGFARHQLELSDDVRQFLTDVVSAVPGLIDVAGLEVEKTLSEEESSMRFPHSESLRQRVLLPAGSPQGESVDIPQEVKRSTAPPFEANVFNSTASSPVVGPGQHLVIATAPHVSVSQTALPTSSPPTPSPNMSETDSQHVEDQVMLQGEDDVFGSSILPTRLKTGKTSSKRKGARTHQAEVHVSRESKRRRTGNESHLESVPDSFTGPVAIAEPEHRSRPSIFAGKWLSKVPSLTGFFSPNRDLQGLPENESTPMVTALQEQIPDVPSRHSMSRQSSASSKSSRKRKIQDVDPFPSSKGDHAPIVVESESEEDEAEDEIPNDEGDEEDELILSPETARAGRAEEQKDIRRHRLESSPALKWRTQATKPPTKRQARGGKEAQAVQETQGRYDDAPDDYTPVMTQRPARKSTSASSIRPDHSSSVRKAGGSAAQPLSSPSSSSSKSSSASPPRTSVHARVLSMMEEASRSRAVIESMNYEDVVKVLHFAREVQEAATSNLGGRVARRRGSGKR